MLQSDPVVREGLKDPQCVAAMQLMSEKPQEAMKRYQTDPRMSAFLKQFASIMAIHFDTLGQQQQPSSTTSAPTPVVQEIGPLHAQVLADNKKKGKEKKDRLTTESYLIDCNCITTILLSIV